jgi:hypothetical protein
MKPNTAAAILFAILLCLTLALWPELETMYDNWSAFAVKEH